MSNMDDVLNEFAEHLTEKSKEICRENECTEEQHNCESYAYFDVEYSGDDIIGLTLVDICCPDYLQRMVNCSIPLPFEGDGKDLKESIDANTDLSEEEQDLSLIRGTEDEDLPLIADQIHTADGEEELKKRISEWEDE